MTIEGVRVSKSGFKPWYLSGPIDQALRTSTQAKKMRVFPLHLKDVHGEALDLELWINEKDWTHDDEPNPNVDQILHVNALANADSAGDLEAVDKLTPVRGVGILIGAGGTDFPVPANGQKGCVLMALMGAHKTSEEVKAEAEKKDKD